MEACFQELGFEKYAEEPGCFAEQADAIYVRRDLWQPPGAGVGRRADERVGGLWTL